MNTTYTHHNGNKSFKGLTHNNTMSTILMTIVIQQCLLWSILLEHIGNGNFNLDSSRALATIEINTNWKLIVVWYDILHPVWRNLFQTLTLHCDLIVIWYTNTVDRVSSEINYLISTQSFPVYKKHLLQFLYLINV